MERAQQRSQEVAGAEVSGAVRGHTGSFQAMQEAVADQQYERDLKRFELEDRVESAKLVQRDRALDMELVAADRQEALDTARVGVGGTAETAATAVVIVAGGMRPSRASRSAARRRATKPPVMAAVRVPPSACSTSQSTVMVRGPSRSRSTAARRERPMRRWISCVRPPGWPRSTSRCVRVEVERGSMAYSAVTQPLCVLRSQPGWRSATLAAQSTRVLPKETRQLPSANS